MHKLPLLLVATAGCSHAIGLTEPDAGSSDPDAPIADAAGPDFSCAGGAQPSVAVDPMTLAGTAVGITIGGTLQPVGGADLALFRAGEPVVLARTQTTATGAFTTGALASGGHPLHAYLKATKPQYRTTFFYPPYPFTANATAIPLPMISDTLFAAIASALGATQDDRHDGALLVAVADCSGHPLSGATLAVTRGNAPAGHAHDLGTILPGAGGVFLVLDVPDGKVRVSASYGGMMLPQHEVVVRAQDRDCPDPRATVTATSVIPGP